jgi:hypothetical protein
MTKKDFIELRPVGTFRLLGRLCRTVGNLRLRRSVVRVKCQLEVGLRQRSGYSFVKRFTAVFYQCL